MLLLILGLLIFFAVHLLPLKTELRAGLIGRFGEAAYKGLFSLLSLVGLVLIILGYAKLQGLAGKNPELWLPPVWTRHLALLLMIPALILLAAAYIPSRIRTAVKHPMLAAIKLWAVAHLLANGDAASVLLFGSFLAYAIVDRISLKTRHAPGPLGDRKGTATGDALAVGVGLVAYAALLLFAHAWLIGVAPLPSLSL
jgi:uncharacterized membrane protein